MAELAQEVSDYKAALDQARSDLADALVRQQAAHLAMKEIDKKQRKLWCLVVALAGLCEVDNSQEHVAWLEANPYPQEPVKRRSQRKVRS